VSEELSGSVGGVLGSATTHSLGFGWITTQDEFKTLVSSRLAADRSLIGSGAGVSCWVVQRQPQGWA